MKYKCLSIAGFDGSGGAGIQADLKTFSATGVYGMNVLTAIAVQNTVGVKEIYDISTDCILSQLETIFEDILPDAIKIGMLFSVEIIEVVADFLQRRAQNIPIVLDPVMLSKSNHPLLTSSAIQSLKTMLVPQAHIITPNLPEASRLVGCDKDKLNLAKKCLALGCKAVLLKGGHEINDFSQDLFLSSKKSFTMSKPRIQSKNTHGTGCTLAAAITSYIAQGLSDINACIKAKEYIHNAILHGRDCNVGKGNGPVHHFFNVW